MRSLFWFLKQRVTCETIEQIEEWRIERNHLRRLTEGVNSSTTGNGLDGGSGMVLNSLRSNEEENKSSEPFIYNGKLKMRLVEISVFGQQPSLY